MNNRAARVALALMCGAVFGFGLSLSGMMNPTRVRGFLDIFGAWDPSLAFVMAGAVGVATVGVRIMRRLSRPVLDTEFHLPAARRIDGRLIGGTALFGVGWGMAGFCPGPALASLPLGLPAVAAFVVTMALGMTVHDRLVVRSK
ncbi:DUF6691 family protein [Nguyenibacter vanlangensis]|uniref:YeeE/YedE family protein n=1 Tax=Nguyenibacter vanlangensis TaxID=1216886 RepID=A0A7Y7IVD2_9PROT|nr:YeeE/YedE family protein [Nguyenibacter vanlangensis]NVN11054.1 YeeE/YedE family protein [Nguyenibacter vanlangensis]